MSIRLLSLTALTLFTLPVLAQDAKPAAKPDAKVAGKADKVDFEKQILPILEKRCVDCHSQPKAGPDGKMRKPKGGVMFDSKEGMLASKKGKLIVAKKADDSQMVKSISLPADDEDRMPPAKKGEPLSKEQIDLIKAWINQGADFGTWVGKPKDPNAGTDKGTDKGGEHEGEGHGKEHGEAPKEKGKEKGHG